METVPISLDSKVRRTTYLFFYHRYGDFPDLSMLLEGEFDFVRSEQLLAIPVLYGEEIPITIQEFQTLAKIPDDNWTVIRELIDMYSIEKEFISKFIDLGIILSDDKSNETAVSFKKKEEVLKSENWNIYAALYHFMTLWKDIDVNLPLDLYEGEHNLIQYKDSMEKVINQHGKPPLHFHEYVGSSSVKKINLPLIKKEEELYKILTGRKTSRLFDKTKEISMQDFSTILYYVFGCHGYFKMHEDMIMLKKTSPSGGSLHPTEAYVLVLNVEKLKPGLYHYSVKNHALNLVKEYSQEEAEKKANAFTAGQNYPSNSGALFIMTSRFFRNFWKYQRHTKSYNVLMMDAAHLSQTFFLVCTQLKLGAYITGAINTKLIEQELKIDGFREGATLIVGCGHPTEKIDVTLLEPNFEPYKFKR